MVIVDGIGYVEMWIGDFVFFVDCLGNFWLLGIDFGFVNIIEFMVIDDIGLLLGEIKNKDGVVMLI